MACDRSKNIWPQRCAVTAIEALVVLVVLGMLLALLAPKLFSSREDSRRVQCGDNLRRIGVALDDHVAKQRYFPPSHSNFYGLDDSSWTTRLLPYFEEQALFERYNFRLPWVHMANSEVKSFNLPMQLCPASLHEDAGQGDYGAVYGPRGGRGLKKGWEKGRAYAAGIMIAVGGETGNKPVRPADVTDGLSRTLTVAEDAGRTDGIRFWVDPHNAFVQEGPINVTRQDEMFSDHPGGAFALFADGRFHFLPDSTDLTVIDAMTTRARGDFVPDFAIDSGQRP
jgi:hypothetical protein